MQILYTLKGKLMNIATLVIRTNLEKAENQAKLAAAIGTMATAREALIHAGEDVVVQAAADFARDVSNLIAISVEVAHCDASPASLPIVRVKERVLHQETAIEQLARKYAALEQACERTDLPKEEYKNLFEAVEQTAVEIAQATVEKLSDLFIKAEMLQQRMRENLSPGYSCEATDFLFICEIAEGLKRFIQPEQVAA